MIRRAGGDAYKQALPPGQGLRPGVGVLVGDRDDPVNHIRGIGLRHEAGADALDLVLARGSAGEHRRTGRLRSEDLYGGIVLLESLSGAAYGPAGPDAGDEDIYLAFGVLPDLLPGRPFVGRRVGRVDKLAEDHGTGSRLPDLLRPPDRALHPVGPRRQFNLRPEGLQEVAPLDAHRVGHREDYPVALRRADPGEADAGVSARRLDDGRAGDQDTPFFRILYHRQRYPVLDRTAGIEEFYFYDDLRHLPLNLFHPQQRRSADQFSQ